ncbi:MAG: hypothetical protein WCQ21_19725, partial [Verrucomicrobiota bacterium]
MADYRVVVKSTDLEIYSRAALASRQWSMRNDPYRPLYHFTGVESWINDPNGPIYHNGKYHLFYQFDPQVSDGKGGWCRSARCWGHAVSGDLVHWKDWPVAVWPDTPYDRNGVYSGNTFSHEGKIHGLYTGNVNGQLETYGMLTWSEDGGVTFKKKMVMPNDQRPNKNSPVTVFDPDPVGFVMIKRVLTKGVQELSLRIILILNNTGQRRTCGVHVEDRKKDANTHRLLMEKSILKDLAHLNHLPV